MKAKRTLEFYIANEISFAIISLITNKVMEHRDFTSNFYFNTNHYRNRRRFTLLAVELLFSIFSLLVFAQLQSIFGLNVP